MTSKKNTPIKALFLERAAFGAGDERRDGVDVAPPEIDAFASCFVRHRAAAAEDVCCALDIKSFCLSELQRFRWDECGELRGVGVDAVESQFC